jgi:RHS repeat-associated protein
MHVSSSGSISDYYFVQGSNYNIEAMLNSSGNIVETYSLSPYGETKIFNASGTDITATGSAISNTYFFQGRHLDSESGLYYFRNRYYSPDLGRFISRDPIGYDAGDINLYRFVGNGPFNNIDPWGLSSTPSNGKCTRKVQNPNYPNTPNGCGAENGFKFSDIPLLIPWGPKITFKPSCDSHDICYGTCGSKKSKCDDDFLKDLKKQCDDSGIGIFLIKKCYDNAGEYYLGVKLWGGAAYNEAQKNACKDEDCGCE